MTSEYEMGFMANILDRRKGLGQFVLAVSFTALTLTGCSSIPDAVNPVEWYKGTVESFAGEDEATETGTADKALDGTAGGSAGKSFPSLTSVPERPKTPAEGLAGDSGGRRYAPGSIARQGEAVNAGADNEPAATAPPPPAVPMAPVAARPLAEATPPATEGPTDVMDVYRRNLAQTRPSGERQDGGSALAYSQPMAAYQDFGTVVIDGAGIQGEMDVPAVASPVAAAPAPVASGQDMVKVATIFFPSGTADLSANDNSILKQVSDLQSRYGARVHVVGHASSRTRTMDMNRHQAVNRQVSAERAQVVAGELSRMGVPSGTMTVDARSDREPLYYEIMPSGEAGNQRAEVYLTF